MIRHLSSIPLPYIQYCSTEYLTTVPYFTTKSICGCVNLKHHLRSKAEIGHHILPRQTRACRRCRPVYAHSISKKLHCVYYARYYSRPSMLHTRSCFKSPHGFTSVVGNSRVQATHAIALTVHRRTVTYMQYCNLSIVESWGRWTLRRRTSRNSGSGTS